MNLWQDIEVYCGNNHEEKVKLQVQQGPFSLFYACPKYHPENRTDSERACPNRINLIDYEAMVLHVDDMLMKASLDNHSENMKNVKWKSKGIEYEIIDHTQDKITIMALNKRSVNDPS